MYIQCIIHTDTCTNVYCTHTHTAHTCAQASPHDTHKLMRPSFSPPPVPDLHIPAAAGRQSTDAQQPPQLQLLLCRWSNFSPLSSLSPCSSCSPLSSLAPSILSPPLFSLSLSLSPLPPPFLLSPPFPLSPLFPPFPLSPLSPLSPLYPLPSFSPLSLLSPRSSFSLCMSLFSMFSKPPT